MNKAEWLQCGRPSTKQRTLISKMLRDWKVANNIDCRCVVHHRDDTEETQKYNEAHYELWGFNEDGTFEYGKYVVFMTRAEHIRYHRTGKKYSEETREKMSVAQTGKKLSEETRAKMSAAKKGKRRSEETRKKIGINSGSRSLSKIYAQYKLNGGKLKWNQFLQSYKEITSEDIAF